MESRFNETAKEILADFCYTHEIHAQVVRILEMWEENGPLNRRQELYAKKVLVWAMEEAKKQGEAIEGFKEKDWLFPFTSAVLWKVAHHEKVMAGMKRRASFSPTLFTEMWKRIPE